MAKTTKRKKLLEGVVVREATQDELVTARKIRYKILDQPFGLEPDPEVIATDPDPSVIHVGAFLVGKMIATARLSPLDETSYRIRRVAVESDYQGQGIGKAMIALGEELAVESGAKRFVLDAQAGSEKFFLALGYGTTQIVEYDSQT